MVKFFVRILLSLCVVLSSGYSQLYAHKHLEANTFAPTKITEVSGQVKAGVKDSHDFFLKSLSSVSEKDGFLLDASDFEEEDDEIRSYKKFVESSNDFAALFFVQVLKSLFRYTNPDQSLHYSEHFTNTLSNSLYLIIEVFRI